MSLPIVLRDEAIAEMASGLDYYEGQLFGLGLNFISQVEATFERIAGSPYAYPVVRADVRRALVHRFPYCVFFRALSNHTEVVAVFHNRRHPSSWIGRIDPL